MPCLCSGDAQRSAAFSTALTARLRQPADTQAAFHVARNGGCEQTLRAPALAAADSVACVGLTEVSRVRANGRGRRCDLELCCRHCQGVWLRIEFKHSFAVQEEDDLLRSEHDNAAQGLLSVVQPATHALVLHQVTLPLADVLHSPIATAHNLHATAAYKHFQPVAQAAAFQTAAAHQMAQRPPLLPDPVVLPAPGDDPAVVHLWFWACKVGAHGALQPWTA